MTVIPAQLNRDVLPTDQSGNVFAPKGLGDTSGAVKELAGSINQLGQVGAEMERQQDLLAQKQELASAQAMADKLYNEHKLYMATNPDDTIMAPGPAGEQKSTLYRENWKKTLADIQKLSGGFIYRDSKAEFDNWVTKSEPTWQLSTDTAVIDSKNDKLIMKTDSILDQLALVSPDTIRTMVGTVEGHPEDLTDDVANRQWLADQAIEELVSVGAVTAQQGMYMSNRAATTIESAATKRMKEGVLAAAQSFRDPESGEIMIEEAIAFVNSSDAPATIKEEIIGKISIQNSYEIKAREQRIEAAQEEDRVAINKLMVAGNLPAYQKAVEDSRLDELEKERHYKYIKNETERIRRGQDIVPNVRTQTLLNHLATNVYAGTADIDDVRRMYDDARFAEVPQIDDAIYIAGDQAMTQAMRAGQAADISNAVRNAIKQITGETVGEGTDFAEVLLKKFAPGAAMTEGERRNWQIVNDFHEELKFWAGKNPDAQHKEFNAFIKDAQVFYKNLSKTRDFPFRIPSAFPALPEDKEMMRKLTAEGQIEAALEARRKELEGVTYKKGDTKTINGTTYTFNGINWDF